MIKGGTILVLNHCVCTGKIDTSKNDILKNSCILSDIQFWNNRKSLEGLSVRSVFFNVFQSLVVLLYVLDNETNTLIKISCFVGLGIEIWKINKVSDVSLDPEQKMLGIFPKIVIKDKGEVLKIFGGFFKNSLKCSQVVLKTRQIALAKCL